MFDTTTSQFIGGCVTLFFAGLIAAAGGVGGGGLIVPILLLIFEYDLATSVALSDCMVVGSSIAQLAINITKRHPNRPNRPLIYWELVLALLPAQLGGANIGEILSHITPQSFIYILALMVLLFASTLTLRKGLHKWHDENEKFAKDKAAIANNDPIISNPILENGSSHVFNGRFSQIFELDRNHSRDHNRDNANSETTRNSIVETLRESLSIYTDSSKLILPTEYIVTILTMWLVYTSLSIARTEVAKCSQPYLVFLGIIYVPLFMAHAVSIQLNKKISTNNDLTITLHQENGEGNEIKQDIDLNENMIPLVLGGYAIGIICSMLGLGGGEIFSPLILSYGVIPQVTSGTTATMSFFNSLTEVLRDITKHEFNLDVAGIIVAVGFLGGLVGRQLGLWISAKYGRASVIVFFLSFGLYLSCLYYIYELGFTSFDSNIHGFC